MNANEEPLALRLTLSSDESSLDTSRRALEDFLAGHALSARSRYRLELVLEEILMNWRWHAWPQGGLHRIDLTAQLLPEAVVLEFIDDGLPFDPLQQPVRDRPKSLDQAVPGGLGLLLMRKAVSQAHYERVGGQNRLTLHMARDA